MKYKLIKSEHEALDEAIQKLYEPDGDGFKLIVEGLPTEDVSGLKKKVDELLSEKKSEQAKREEAEKAAQEAKDKAAKEAGNYKELFESSENKVKTLEEALKDRDARDKRQSIGGKALELAQGLTKDVSRAKLLAEQLKGRLDLVDGELKVLDTAGALTVSTTDELVEQVKKDYPFLVDGKDSSGGGSSGDKGGAGDSKKITRDQFNEMDHVARSKFAKDGGKVED